MTSCAGEKGWLSSIYIPLRLQLAMQRKAHTTCRRLCCVPRVPCLSWFTPSKEMKQKEAHLDTSCVTRYDQRPLRLGNISNVQQVGLGAYSTQDQCSLQRLTTRAESFCQERASATALRLGALSGQRFSSDLRENTTNLSFDILKV